MFFGVQKEISLTVVRKNITFHGSDCFIASEFPMKKLFPLASLFGMFALVACGGDSGSSSGSSDAESSSSAKEAFDTVDDLPNCYEGREGMTVSLAEDSLTYVCISDAWEGFDYVADVKGDLPSCTTNRKNKTALVDGSEMLVCDGKRWSESDAQSSSSEGTAKSSSSKVPDSSSSDEKSTSSSSGAVDSSSSVIADGSEDNVAVEDVTIDGVGQKGPFFRESAVYVSELQNGKNLKQTGKGFNGTISSDDGKYKIPSVSLTSQYAFITVNGYYRDETTGNKSSQNILLKAITDLTGRTKANVNILSSIEYDRVYHLVTKEGLTVGKAKTQAEQEIFEAFHLNIETKTKTEDLDIFGTSDADAALLAISILLQGGRDATEFAAMLSKLSEDFAPDGKWDDAETRGNIAKWAVRKTVKDSLIVFRKNVEGWGFGDVPGFEKYIGAFVEGELNLDILAECEDNAIRKWEDVDLEIACKDSKWIFKDWLVDSRDNQVYRTVKIGSQTWMAENLNYEYNEGGGESLCYNNEPVNCMDYGRLYTWSAAVDSAAVFSETAKGCGFVERGLSSDCPISLDASITTVVRGVCPEGWHLPNNADWDSLWVAIGGTSTAGVKLKSSSGWGDAGNGKDDYGFTVLPAGGSYLGSPCWLGKYGYFWSSSRKGGSDAYYKHFGYTESDVKEFDNPMTTAISVRCVRDN